MAMGPDPTQHDKPRTSTMGLTGWAAMANTVRDIDEEKVRYCKEDIDTLLVFAGLFSAVLTAFLIESYHNLQPPDSNVMASTETTILLREIAMNTRASVFGTGDPNSTSTAAFAADAATAVGAPYSPPLSAVRVNTLWFASLVFSLATASFGMSVKQWLREYLACDYTSPQARLRIRQHRDPGMRAWKVLQLAAMLPLLLQLSLALFFLGLCFFTWSIEHTVARTTIALVCAWAFFLCASFALPIFFPHCPYKTTAFVRVTRFLRGRYFGARTFLSAVLLARNGASTSSALPGGLAHGRGRWLHRIAQRCGESIKPGDHREEHEVAHNGDNDMNMLISVDSALTDDHILGTTIWDAVQQLRLSPSDTLSFLFQVVEHRVHLPTSQSSSSHSNELFNLRALTFQGWQAVTNIAGSVISRGLESSAVPVWSLEMKTAFCFLLSHSSHPMPDQHVLLLQKCLQSQSWSSCSAIIQRLSLRDGDESTHILRRFRRSLIESPLSGAIPHFTRILEAIFRVDTQHHSSPLWKLLRDRACANSSPDSMWSEILDIIAELIWNITGDDEVEPPATELPFLRFVICALFHVPVSEPSTTKFCDIFRHVCAHDKGIATTLLLIATCSSIPDDPEWTVDLITDRMRVVFGTTIDDITRLKFLRAAANALRDHASRADAEPNTPVVNMVRLCRVLLDTHGHLLMDSVTSRRSHDNDLFPCWQQLWDTVVLVLVRLAATSDGSSVYEADALECFALLNAWYQRDTTRIGVTKPPQGITGRDDSTEPFPDALFAVLSLFVSDHATLHQYDNLQRQLTRSGMLHAVPGPRLSAEFRGETFWKFLLHSGFKSHLLFARLLDALRANIPSLQIGPDSNNIPDCTAITQNAWVITAHVAASTIMHALPDNLDAGDTVQYTQDMQHALLLLLARSDHNLPDEGVHALAACVRMRTQSMTQRILLNYAWSRDPAKLEHVLRRMRPSMAHLPNALTTCCAVITVARCAFYRLREGELCQHKRFIDCAWAHQDSDCEEFWLAIHNIHMDRVGDLVARVTSGSALADNWYAFDWSNGYRLPKSAKPHFYDMLGQLLLHPSTPADIYGPLTTQTASARLPTLPALAEGIRAAYRMANTTMRWRFVRVFVSFPRDYTKNKARSKDPLNYICVFHLHLEIYKAHCPLVADEEVCLPVPDLREGWSELWTATAASLRKFAKEKELDPEEQFELALESFTLLDAFEGRTQAAHAASPPMGPGAGDGYGPPSAETGPSPFRLFPDELYAALAAFVPTDKVDRIARFEHIQERLPSSHRQRSPPVVLEESASAGARRQGNLAVVRLGAANEGTLVKGSEECKAEGDEARKEAVVDGGTGGMTDGDGGDTGGTPGTETDGDTLEDTRKETSEEKQHDGGENEVADSSCERI